MRSIIKEISAKSYHPEGLGIWAKTIGTVPSISFQMLRPYSKCAIFGKFFFRDYITTTEVIGRWKVPLLMTD